MAEDFDERLSQLERALKVISTIENNPDLQSAAFTHLFGAARSLAVPAPRATERDAVTVSTDEKGDGESDDADVSGGSRSRGRSRGLTKRAGKTSVSQDKTLDPSPPNVQSWKEFVAEKSPGSQADRNTVAVYWLKEIAGLEKATVNQVFTLYVDANWKPPADPRNSLQVTASQAGTLDTADTMNIKLTPRGIGLVKNDLPRPDKKK